jgi:hypothetical protein
MSTSSFTTTIVVKNSPGEAFNAINNVSDWWQGEIKGMSHQLGDEFSYQMMDVHYSKQKLIEMIPDKKVTWQVTDSKLKSFKNKAEWTGTKIIFEINETSKGTEIRFTHEGLVPAIQCYGDCSNAWGMLVNESLFSLITTGKGKKVFG